MELIAISLAMVAVFLLEVGVMCWAIYKQNKEKK